MRIKNRNSITKISRSTILKSNNIDLHINEKKNPPVISAAIISELEKSWNNFKMLHRHNLPR